MKKKCFFHLVEILILIYILEVVTSVFRQYETGLREGVIDVKVTVLFLKFLFM